ncbi:transcriptional regulator with XRE-family HTH domain [Methylobacterium sp. OAE515]|uniref:helix-turn-helix domain-containing protein n=1 Tax=Methylobacterium sp. OAE515 TaxID=2817895 RepID=UPI001789ED4D
MSSTELAFLRDQTMRGPSRPRYLQVPHIRREDTPADLLERLRVGRVLKQARVRKGISQHEAGRQMGLQQGQLSSWERGREAIPPSRRPMLAEFYGFDAELLAGLDIAEVAITPDERALLNRFRAASEDERRAALAAVCP